MQSIIQILKLNDLKKGISKKTGNPYEMQDAECLLLTDAGEVDQVGVLDIPKSLREVAKPGTFTASFAMHAGFQDRRISAVLTGLVPIKSATDRTPLPPAPPAPAVATPAAPAK